MPLGNLRTPPAGGITSSNIRLWLSESWRGIRCTVLGSVAVTDTGSSSYLEACVSSDRTSHVQNSRYQAVQPLDPRYPRTTSGTTAWVSNRYLVRLLHKIPVSTSQASDGPSLPLRNSQAQPFCELNLRVWYLSNICTPAKPDIAIVISLLNSHNVNLGMEND